MLAYQEQTYSEIDEFSLKESLYSKDYYMKKVN